MKGYALTVLQGTVPERFEFEVVGIARNMLPRMDLILVKSDDPKLAVTGFAAGMSGSPMYIDGKVACAFSYSFRFSKIALGACTPLEYMIKDSKHTERGPDLMSMASLEEWRKYVPSADMSSPGDTWLAHALPVRPTAPSDQRLAQASLPLNVSGLGPAAFDMAKKLFEPYGMEPMQGIGAGGDPKQGPSKFEMGGAVAVELLRGDATANVSGTVSYVDDNRVLAFGHPYMGAGEAYMPTATAEVEVVIPSLQNSMKMAAPLRPLGSLTQDRQSGVTIDTTKTAPMVPVDIRVRNAEGQQSFHSEVVSHRFLTPQLASMALAQALQVMVPDITDVTITVRSTVQIKGYEPLSFTDYMYSAEGMSPNTLTSVRGLRLLVPLMFNPFKPIKLEHVELTADITYKADFADIQSLRLPEVEVPVDRDTWVDVQLRPYNGKAYTQRVPLRIPRRLAGATVKLEVLPGDQAKADAANPENLDEVMDVLRNKTFPANVLVATIYTPEEGVTLEGRVIPDLPDSAIDTVRPAAATKRSDAYRSILRAVAPVKQVLQGRQELVVKIADLK